MKKCNFIVYAHINKINSKIYIGITSQTLNQRCRNGDGYRGCGYFYNAIQKYGWDNFEHIVLIDNLTKDVACICEKYLIAKYKTNNMNYGYNLTSGGEYTTFTEIAKQHIKENHADFSGINHPLYGKKHKEETKQKIREKHIGKKQGIQQREKHKEDMMGIKNPRAKRVRCINNNMIFNTTREAAKWNHQYDGSYIGKCCKGLCSYAGHDLVTGEKLSWEYI